MASPQKENGHTGIANELLGALIQADLNGSEYSMIFTVIRMTYGFQKKKDRISYSQFEKYMNTCRSVVNKTVKSLVAKRILVATRLPLGNEYGLNKDYSKWVVAKGLLVAKMDLGSSQTPLLGSSQVEVYKRNNTKEKQKGENKIFSRKNPNCKLCGATDPTHESFCQSQPK